jgi:glycogen debranching enzyme
VHADLFSGWGVRTLSSTAPRYNPMSYHNGSIWPHDNAIVAAGCRRYGLYEEALAIFSALFDASTFLELHRLPELFCGFPRRHGEGPTEYPVACNPQAWASGSAFLLLQAALGLEIDAPARTVRFIRSILPPFLDEVVLRNLRIADAVVDVQLDRHVHDVGIHVLRREGDVQVVGVK